MEEAEQKKDIAQRLPTLETAARTLTDTRNALAHALRTLKDPADFPLEGTTALTEIENAQATLETEATDGAKRDPALNLSDCFLAGADLRKATLSGANLLLATLSGADLSEATLSGTNLSEAMLTGANLGFANLTGARVAGSSLDEAKFIPPTWEQADYKGFFDREDTELRQRVEAAYRKQPEELRKWMEASEKMMEAIEKGKAAQEATPE